MTYSKFYNTLLLGITRAVMFTKKQIDALKILIYESKDCDVLAKKLLLFLINRSEKLTRQVTLTLTEREGGFSRDEVRKICLEADRLSSVEWNTHLYEIFCAMGTRFFFSMHFGHYNENGRFDHSGQFSCNTTKMRFTFWLSKSPFGYKDKGNLLKLKITRKGLVNVRLPNPMILHAVRHSAKK